MKTSLICFGKKNEMKKKKLCINGPTVERKKKPPKILENFHGYSTSDEHCPETVEDSFQKIYYKAYNFVIAAIKKDLISLTIKCMLLYRMFC